MKKSFSFFENWRDRRSLLVNDKYSRVFTKFLAIICFLNPYGRIPSERTTALIYEFFEQMWSARCDRPPRNAKMLTVMSHFSRPIFRKFPQNSRNFWMNSSLHFQEYRERTFELVPSAHRQILSLCIWDEKSWLRDLHYWKHCSARRVFSPLFLAQKDWLGYELNRAIVRFHRQPHNLFSGMNWRALQWQEFIHLFPKSVLEQRLAYQSKFSRIGLRRNSVHVSQIVFQRKQCISIARPSHFIWQNGSRSTTLK